MWKRRLTFDILEKLLENQEEEKTGNPYKCHTQSHTIALKLDKEITTIKTNKLLKTSFDASI